MCEGSLDRLQDGKTSHIRKGAQIRSPGHARAPLVQFGVTNEPAEEFDRPASLGLVPTTRVEMCQLGEDRR